MVSRPTGFPEHLWSKIAMMAHPVHPCKRWIDDYAWGHNRGLINTPLQTRLIMWPSYFEEDAFDDDEEDEIEVRMDDLFDVDVLRVVLQHWAVSRWGRLARAREDY